jgi:hypothetical protein
VLKNLAILLCFSLAGPLAGCAQFEFDVTPDGSKQPVHVADSGDAHLTVDPLQYRMRADEGHLVIWIDNPTNDPIELLGNKSSVIDPDEIDHPLHNQTIRPLSSVKEILPPLESQGEAAATNSPAPINPYDRPGFIPVPGIDQSDSPDERENQYDWQWEDASEIRIHLVFMRNGQQFEQRFTINRVKK